MVLQILYMKIKHDIFPFYKPLIFCVKINQKIGIFMCKGETNETTCDRYTKRNNR